MRREAREIVERVKYLEIPIDVAERSATEVRELVRSGKSITGLVPRIGSRTVTTVPAPTRDDTLMVPLWSVTMRCTIARPKPVPLSNEL